MVEEKGESMLTLLEVEKIDHGRDAIFQTFDLEESNNMVALKKKKKMAEIIFNLGPVIWIILLRKGNFPQYFSGH